MTHSNCRMWHLWRNFRGQQQQKIGAKINFVTFSIKKMIRHFICEIVKKTTHDIFLLVSCVCVIFKSSIELYFGPSVNNLSFYPASSFHLYKNGKRVSIKRTTFNNIKGKVYFRSFPSNKKLYHKIRLYLSSWCSMTSGKPPHVP